MCRMRRAAGIRRKEANIFPENAMGQGKLQTGRLFMSDTGLPLRIAGQSIHIIC